MASNTKIIPVSLPRGLARELDQAAEREQMTRSEFVRDMLRRRIAFMKLGDFRQEFARRARKNRIRTVSGAVSAVRKLRAK